MMRSVALILLLAASACAGGPRGSPCDGWSAIRPEPADVDVVSDSLAAQILGHNEHGASVCGWTPG